MYRSSRIGERRGEKSLLLGDSKILYNLLEGDDIDCREIILIVDVEKRCLLARGLKDLSKSGVGITSKFIEHVFYGATWKLPFLDHLHLLEAMAYP